MLFLWIIFVIAIYAFLKFHLNRKRLSKYVKDIKPATKQYPFFGIANRFMWKNPEEIMQVFIDVFAEFDTPTKFWFGPQLVIALDKPEDIQAILTSPNCYEKSHVYKFLHNDLGLFSATTKLWKNDRKLLTPTLNFNVLMSFLPIFNEKTNLLIASMEKELNNRSPFDISTYLFACTLDMVCATTLGYDIDVQINKNRDYLESWEKCIQMVGKRMFCVPWHSDFIYTRTNAFKLEKEQFDIAETLPNMIIAIKKKEFLEKRLNESTTPNSNSEEIDENECYKTPQIFIDQLLKLYEKGQISDLGMLHQVNLLIFGGNDTSALAISHSILLLAMHPEIQDRVVQEIHEVFDTKDMYTNYEMISKLNYTEMVIREAMRLFPIAPFLARRCLANTKIKNCNNCTIPEDTLVFISVWGLHRSTDIWGPHANEFNPDNFLPEKVAVRHPYSYIPFSAGPRNCLGMKYALISMKIMLAALLRNYKFSTELKLKDLRTKFEITMKLVNKHMVTIERRNFKDKR